MAKHWKAFIVGWVVLLVIFFIVPPAPWITDPLHQFASAVGATFPPVFIVLICAGVGRLAKGRTAVGMGVGGTMATLFMIAYLVGMLS